MTRLAIAILVSALLTLYAEQASAEGRRVALVIGVSAYQSVPKLPNAVNDADAVADMFRKASFDVVMARDDVGNLELKRAIREFEDAVTDSDIAVVFYAGHGIEIRETNYIIPTDAKLINERDAEDEAISLDRILTALEPAKRLRLVMLDACRDNPFASKMKRRVATRAITAGLGKVEPAQTDTLIAYAAKEKSVANDGEGGHSPFTTALLANLTVPGLDVRLAFGRVRDDVLRATNRQQEPFVYGSLGGGTVALVPVRAEAALTPVNVRADYDASKSDYEIVERVAKKEAWEVYLNTHKTGLYADLARVQLAKLATPATDGITRVLSDAPNGGETNARTSPKADVPPVAAVPRASAAEQKAWDKLKAGSDRAAIAKFIEAYPTSPLVADAQARLDTLERLAREREESVRIEREAARQRDEDEKQKKAVDSERRRLEREAAKQREEAERARIAEAGRQKAEALAATRQREAEERARAAEAAARKREEEETARLATIAARKREAETRAQALAAERAKAEGEAAARKREAEEAAGAAVAAKAAREAEERAQTQALQAHEREEKAKAAAIAEGEREEKERARAAEIATRQKEAEERTKAAEAERKKAEAEAAVNDRADEQNAKTAEVARLKSKAAAEAERRKAQEAAEAAAEIKAERAAAARKREAAERAREVADEAAAANRRKAQEAGRRAVERQAERAAAAAEQRRRSAQQAKEATRARATQAARPAPAPRVRSEARASAPAPRASGGGGGGGAAPMVGIGF